MYTDSRFVDLCFAQVRLHTLLEQRRFVDHCISDCQNEISRIQSDISKQSSNDITD